MKNTLVFILTFFTPVLFAASCDSIGNPFDQLGQAIHDVESAYYKAGQQFVESLDAKDRLQTPVYQGQVRDLRVRARSIDPSDMDSYVYDHRALQQTSEVAARKWTDLSQEEIKARARLAELARPLLLDYMTSRGFRVIFPANSLEKSVIAKDENLYSLTTEATLGNHKLWILFRIDLSQREIVGHETITRPSIR